MIPTPDITIDSWKDLSPGVHSLSFSDYRELPYTNWHTLAPFRESALAGRRAMSLPSVATNIQEFGAAFHAAVLEPHVFERDYVTQPKFDGHPSSNVHKDAKRAWLAANADKVPLLGTERAELLAMQDAAKRHPIASAMLYGKGRNEMSIVWDDPDTMRRCKGRVDRVAKVRIGVINPVAANAADDALCLIDVKTTRSVNPREFTKDAAKFGYHAQLAFYLDGLNAVKPAPYSVFIVAIQNSPPFDVVVFQLGDDELDEGRKVYRRLLNTLVHCEQNNEWPGISDRVVPLYLPDWAKEGDL